MAFGSTVRGSADSSAGLDASDYRLLSPAVAGPFARWIAMTDLGPRKLRNCRGLLQDLLSRLDSYDAIDRAEILMALTTINSREGIVDADLQLLLAAKLLDLPAPAQSQLRILFETHISA